VISGHTRVNTQEQNLGLQTDELIRAGREPQRLSAPGTVRKRLHGAHAHSANANAAAGHATGNTKGGTVIGETRIGQRKSTTRNASLKQDGRRKRAGAPAT
jgi:hypothetical protein